MTHPDNWVQKQIDEMNIITNDRLTNAINHVNNLSKEEFVRDLIEAGYREADLHMGSKYTDISTPRRCLVCGKFHVDTGLPCTDYPWEKFYPPITTEDTMKDLRQWVIKDTTTTWLEELARLDQEYGLYEQQMSPVFKLYYDKTLRMSEGKLAAQVGHVVAHLTLKHGKVPSKIIVLEASHTKFESYCKSADYVQRDLGLTEVEEGAATVCGSAEFE